MNITAWIKNIYFLTSITDFKLMLPKHTNAPVEVEVYSEAAVYPVKVMVSTL